MNATLSGEAFNRLVGAVKAFVDKRGSRRPCDTLIHILFSAEECKATAYALDGYRAAKETVACGSVDEDFDVLISVPRLKAVKSSIVEVRREGDKSIVDYGDIQFHTKNPGGELFDVETAISAEVNKPKRMAFGINADYMIDALRSLKESGAAIGKPVTVEFTSPLAPILMRTDKDNYKMVLPVRIRE